MTTKQCPGMNRSNWTPDDIVDGKCPSCGRPMEFWKDDVRRKCPGCGKLCFNPNVGNTCLAWCAHAAECLGNRDIETWKKEHGFTDRKETPGQEADDNA